MKKIGFVKSTKENEKRRALLPEHLSLISNTDYLYFEEGYGIELCRNDEEYREFGAHVVSREEALTMDIICDPKIGDAEYLSVLKPGQTIFGWVHAVQNRSITEEILSKKLTAIAWEDMNRGNRHVFWENNELAGEAAILHSYTFYGKLPRDSMVALIGRGNTARGAYKVLVSLGANVVIYDRNTENSLREDISSYDVIVNAVLWDVYRDDHIVYRNDLLKMKKPALIIDVSCDRAGAIETSVPTTIEEPIYFVDDVMHYAVDHTPALISYSASNAIGKILAGYLDDLIEEKSDSKTLSEALIIQDGQILDQRIIDYQQR